MCSLPQDYNWLLCVSEAQSSRFLSLGVEGCGVEKAKLKLRV
jgi:hypothetical protein